MSPGEGLKTIRLTSRIIGGEHSIVLVYAVHGS